MSDEGERVVLRVYDLSNGMARTMSQQFLGMQVDIVPHTGVFVYGREWFFSGGIQSAPSWGMMPMHEEIVLGQTGVPLEIFAEFIEGVREQYTAATYNLATNNCNHFSNAVVEFLAGVQVPERILNLPEQIMATPMGQAFMPMLAQMGGAMDPLGGGGGGGGGGGRLRVLGILLDVRDDAKDGTPP